MPRTIPRFKGGIFHLPKYLYSLILSVLCVVVMTSVSYGGEAEVIMKLLLQKGIITKAEYNEVMGELKGIVDIEEKVKQNEVKIDALAKQQHDQQEKITHVDKHIAHMEDVATRTVAGLNIAGGVTVVAQGSSGNDDNNAADGDVTDGSYSADLEISAPIADKGEAFLHVEAGEGTGLEGDEITSFWGVNGDAGDSSARLEVTEAWYEHRFMDDKLAFTVGKLDLSNYFDGNEVANNETVQFLSGGFVNNIAIEFPGNSGGTRLTLSPNELLDCSIAWQSGDGDWEDILDNSFYMAEVDVKPTFGELQGNYRFYGWTNQTDHTKISTSAGDDAGWGVGVSLDQQLTEAVTFFARLGYQDEDLYNFDIAWSAGFSVAGSLWDRENDAFGIAYGMALLSDDFENTLPNPEDEDHFEAYYSFYVNEHLAITPDIQVMNNASGDGDFDTVWLGAVRGQLTF